MSESGMSTSIVSSILSLLLKVWNEWNVRVMVLLSLFLQIILSVLGSCRKYKNNFFTGIVLRLAYESADWIAIAALSKLPSSYPGSPTSNILRAFWAPLLILHLGGPDTITTYAYEENKLWPKHLLILVAKVVLVIYIIFSSWTTSWISFLTLPLIIAGIAKYVERILCLFLNNYHKTEPIFSVFNVYNVQPQPFLKDNEYLFKAYFIFSIMRPDVNNYLSYSLSTAKTRIEAFHEEIIEGEREKLAESFLDRVPDDPFDSQNEKDTFDSIRAGLGLIFDFIYTKSALIHTKTGCFLRLASFICSFLVLLLFLISIINKSKFIFPIVDIYITGILLSGAIALELYAAWVMFSSDWAILVAVLHPNVLVRKMFCIILKRFPCFLNRRKRWLDHMGQFDLLKYCWQYKKKEANRSCVGLQMITSCRDLIEMWRKYMYTDFVMVPSYLKERDEPSDFDSFFLEDNTFKASRGKRALQKGNQYDNLKWSIELDFDYSIIVWHLATSVCYYHDNSQHHEDAKNISKWVSDYMMYLLAMRPTMILPEDSKSFWLDRTCDRLKELFFPTHDIEAAYALFLNMNDDDDEESHEPRKSTLESMREDVRKLTARLNKLRDKWEVIREVWIEILLCAAYSSSNISHVKQLGEGGEFLSLLWLGGCNFIFNKAFTD